MATFSQLLEASLTPSIPSLLLAIVILFGAPLILHIILSNSATYTVPPQVLLLGPSTAGKTALLTLLERGADPTADAHPSATHTTQVCQSVELNASTDSDNKHSYRNADDTGGTYTKFLMVDTPGHGKLRTIPMGRLERGEKTRGVVFMVDASALSEQDVLSSTASYLYDVLLLLQKRASGPNGKSKAPIPILVAANKMDLFTALPSTLVKTNLEAELTRIRVSRSKGLLDSGVGENEIGNEEQDDWLGEYGSEKFGFGQMAEFGVDVEVLPGNVVGDDGPGVGKWWWWIAQRV